MRLVVDASVAIKWSIQEEDHAEALTVLRGGHELLLPDLALIEFGNILWKKVIRKEIGADQAVTALEYLQRTRPTILPSGALVPRALAIAIQLQHPIYDCIYLAAAERAGATLVTADRRLLNSLKGNALVSLARPLSEIAAL